MKMLKEANLQVEVPKLTQEERERERVKAQATREDGLLLQEMQVVVEDQTILQANKNCVYDCNLQFAICKGNESEFFGVNTHILSGKL